MTIAASATLLLTMIITSPAHAVDVANRGCTTTGASGGVAISNWYGPDAKVGLEFNLVDIKGDRHSVGIRLLSKNVNGKTRNWPWHKNLDGAGTTKTWTSTASDSSGLFEIGVQVATLEGNTIVNSCTAWH